MKRFLFLLLAVLTALAFCGCASMRADGAQSTRTPISQLDVTLHPVWPSEGTVIADPSGKGDEIDPIYRSVFSGVYKVGGGSVAGSYYRVFTDSADFEAALGSYVRGGEPTDETEFSFNFNFYVAVYITNPTGGFTVELDRAMNDGNTVSVSVTCTPPAPGAMVTQAFETKCVLVGFDRGDLYDDLVYEITVNGQPVAPAGDAA